MIKITRTVEQLQKARARVAKLEADFAEQRLEALKTVTMTKTGATITLVNGSSVFKAKKPARFNDRWNITKDGKRIATEVFGGIHDIRFAIALGQIK
jgi:hypothetical protein